MIYLFRNTLFQSIASLEKGGARLFCENRASSFWLTAVTAVAGTSLWTWDYVLDPQHAFETVWLRLSIIPAAIPYLLALRYSANRWVAFACAIAMFMMWEAGFILITERLERGQIFGIAGFMYFVFMPLVVARVVSMAQLVILIAFITCSAPVMASLFGVQGFEISIYFATLGPASILCLLTGAEMISIQQANADYRDNLEREATTDPLTGLGNRRLFYRSVESRMTCPGDVCLLTVDLDGFKSVNDTYGHAAGDILLKCVARCLDATFHPQHQAFRLGGDEFAILLAAGTGAVVAEDLAKALACKLPGEKMSNGYRFVVSASIGVAVHQGLIMSIEELMSKADVAMYEAKRRGGGTTCLAA